MTTGIDANPPTMTYHTVQPNRWTFESDKIRRWVESHLQGTVLNACAGRTRLDCPLEVVRNDANPDMPADHHVDVTELTDVLGRNSVDSIVYDPPYTEQQADSAYEGYSVSDESDAMAVFHQLLRPGGVVIKLGYSTTCMPAAWGYRRTSVAVFNTFGRSPDWLGAVDKRIQLEMEESYA